MDCFASSKRLCCNRQRVCRRKPAGNALLEPGLSVLYIHDRISPSGQDNKH